MQCIELTGTHSSPGPSTQKHCRYSPTPNINFFYLKLLKWWCTKRPKSTPGRKFRFNYRPDKLVRRFISFIFYFIFLNVIFWVGSSKFPCIWLLAADAQTKLYLKSEDTYLLTIVSTAKCTILELFNNQHVHVLEKSIVLKTQRTIYVPKISKDLHFY